MGIADRIILTLYTFLMAIVSILILLCSLEVFSSARVTYFFDHIPGNWIFAVASIVMLLVSVRLLITGLGITGMSSLKLSEGPKGKILVGRSALENYISALAQEIYGIHHVKVIVKLEDEGIDVRINTSVEPGINIPEATAEIKNNVKESLKKVTGIEVRDIELFVKQIKSKEE